jgi:carlactone synthase/all-trans-10'-apo-beta-carotenal 13,14-cleaving dioxygenase
MSTTGGDYAQMEHMFDGYALVVKARFKGGRAWGRQRYLDTAAYRAFKESGRVVFREFATAPQPSGPLDALRTAARDLLGILTNNSQFTDNASVNLHSVGARRDGGANGAANSRTAPRKQLLATSETPKASYLVDPLTLATAAPAKFNDGVKGDLTTAHPTVLSDGRLLNFTRTLPSGGFNLFTLDPDTLARTPVAFVADRRPLSPAWLHDFPANDEYAVIVENPLYMSLGSLLFGSPRPYVFMDWKPEDGTRVTVVRLDGSEVRYVGCL